ncbi:MAG: hypothetical protein H7Z16_04760 [Pyrinomonadaceae bacterium]|nr:hypothetical protein [Pyrinomonadaceae bacterium]
MKRYVITSVLTALLAAVFFFYPQQFSDGGGAAAQRRGVRRGVKPTPALKTRREYSRFSHATNEHQESCKTCHKTPTPNWKQVRDFPDVADFPDHDACVRCHRPQFFKSAQPVICSDCHQKTSPRDSARFDFRNPVRPRQFTIEFPHDKHQDVIARREPSIPTVTQTVRLRAWAHSQSVFYMATQTNSLRYNNCEICHVANTKPPVAPSSGWTDGFVPAANMFKASPESHDACFSCHWKSVEPTKDNCAGCHKPASPYLPTGIPERKSLRFTHVREQHVKECTACHINITKSASVKGLKPDVPITSCTECHNKEGLRLDVSGELIALDKDAAFVCVYCHTSDVGRRNPPASHYLISGRAPVKLR